MNLSLLRKFVSVANWGDYIWETKYKLTAPKQTNLEITWPFEQKKAANITVLWPNKYQWAPMAKWGEPIANSLAYHVKVKRKDIEQPYKGIILVEASINGKIKKIIFDISDYLMLNSDANKSAAIYFKYQYATNGYYPHENVLPAGYIPYEPKIYEWLPYLRYSRDKNDFDFDIYGRFGFDMATEIRHKAIKLLSSSKQFIFEGGGKKQRYSRFLKEVTRSKICIDLPGNGPFCFRLVDYLAIGSCVIAYPHASTLPSPLISGEHICYVENDFSNLLCLCEKLLSTPSLIGIMCSNTRDYFDKYLHARQLGAYYVKKIIDYNY